MNADQVIEGIGRAVEATKPAQEYCLFWLDLWPMCMTKAEWSGWMQVFGVMIAIHFSARNALKMWRLEKSDQQERSDRRAEVLAMRLTGNVGSFWTLYDRMIVELAESPSDISFPLAKRWLDLLSDSHNEIKESDVDLIGEADRGVGLVLAAAVVNLNRMNEMLRLCVNNAEIRKSLDRAIRVAANNGAKQFAAASARVDQFLVVRGLLNS